jgi:hypothetical protein
MAVRAYAGDPDTSRKNAVLDAIFANDLMVFGARVVLLTVGLLILILCAYAGTSIVVRMARGEWLHRGGGLAVELARYEEQLAALTTCAKALGEISVIQPDQSQPHAPQVRTPSGGQSTDENPESRDG